MAALEPVGLVEPLPIVVPINPGTSILPSAPCCVNHLRQSSRESCVRAVIGAVHRLLPLFTYSPTESRVYVLLVESGIKPAADVEVGPEDAKWFGSYLTGHKIHFVTSENDEEHGSGVTFYFSKHESKAKALRLHCA